MKIPIEKVFNFSYSMQTALKELRLEGFHKIEAVPRLEDLETILFKNKIKEHSKPGESLILDFENWDNTFYLGISAPTDNERLFILDGAKHGGGYIKELLDILHKSNSGLILLNKASRFSEFYSVSGKDLVFKDDVSFFLRLKEVKSTEFLSLFSFEVLKDQKILKAPSVFETFPIGSLEYKKAKIKQDSFWYRDIVYKSKENNTSEEFEINKAAENWKY